MAENATTQVVKNKGFKNFDVGSMIEDGIIGAVSSAVGGSRMGKTVNIKTLNSNLTKKIKTGAWNTIKKGVKYYASQTKTIYKEKLLKPMAKATITTLVGKELKG